MQVEPGDEFDAFRGRHGSYDHAFPEETSYFHAHDVDVTVEGVYVVQSDDSETETTG
ncbi:hypothetical protein [Halorussus halophilus]|uniref:hypothetical protein n=1 Tax=Halorussus halophilus TaxID=2650975 RepID=UPI0017881984|nr:hypothetical protein [Halorussus halophilus]